MKTVKVETNNGHIEEFEVVPIKCKIGDTIYFDNDGSYLKGIVESIEPNYWWIYDDGTKVYGKINVKCTTKESYYYDHNFSIDALDIIYNKPDDYDRYWCKESINPINYNEKLVKQFRDAEKEFQKSDLYLLGLFECASSYAALKAQEKTIDTICDYLNNHVFKDIKNEFINSKFIIENLKRDLGYE